MRKIVLTGLVASFAILAVAESAFADHRRRGRNRGRASVYISTPYFSAQYGRSPRRAYWGDRNYGGYYDGYYSQPSYITSPWYAEGDVQQHRSFYAGSNNSRQGEIRVLVPDANAEVSFGGKPTETKGFERAYVTKELDGTYIYTVKASWMDDGQEVTLEKKVEVRPGEQVVVAFGDRDASERADRRRGERLPLPEETAIATPMRGKVVRISDGDLVMADMDGNNEHKHRLAVNAKIIIDGRDGQLQDLKAGDEIRVTLKKEKGSDMASRIEVTSRGETGVDGTADGQRTERKEQPPQ